MEEFLYPEGPMAGVILPPQHPVLASTDGNSTQLSNHPALNASGLILMKYDVEKQ